MFTAKAFFFFLLSNTTIDYQSSFSINNLQCQKWKKKITMKNSKGEKVVSKEKRELIKKKLKEDLRFEKNIDISIKSLFIKYTNITNDINTNIVNIQKRKRIKESISQI